MFPNKTVSTRKLPQNKRQSSIIELDIRRSIGAISPIEYKRRRILNEINDIAYASNKTSNSPIFLNLLYDGYQTNIRSMEIDPKEHRCLLVGFGNSNITSNMAIYDVDKDVEIFKIITHLPIPRTNNHLNGIPNSVHWLFDGTIFTACSNNAVHFWDSSTCTVIDEVKLEDLVLNHIIATNEYSSNKHVAVTGMKGYVFLIDIRYGFVVMTLPNVEKSPIRTINWHPNNDLQYVTGNDNGNIFLWDIRFPKKFVRKFNNDDSFVKTASHSHPIAGLSFYNNGNSILSVDLKGTIKTWDVNKGRRYPNHYEPITFSDTNDSNFKSYQFAITENLKQDIVFLPSKKGLRIFDIDTGEHLPNSNDINLPLNCATYSYKNLCVYSASCNIIKAWTTDQKHTQNI